MIAELIESALIAAVVSAAVSYAMRPKQITRKVRGPYKVKNQQSLDVEPQLPEVTEPKEVAEGFAVSGPTRVPWRQRRKELEAQHRTKRKAIKEFREG